MRSAFLFGQRRDSNGMWFEEKLQSQFFNRWDGWDTRYQSQSFNEGYGVGFETVSSFVR